MRNRTAAAGIGSIALAIAMLLPAAAQAHNPIAGGKTKLKLNGGTAKVLAANGVAVKPLRPAAGKGGGIVFPVTGGEVSSDGSRAMIDHSGGLAFKAGGKSLKAKSFRINLRKNPKLTAKVGSARVPLLKLNTRKANIKRNGLNTKYTGVRGSLTTVAARALNATFGVKLFKNGIPVGKTTTLVKPESVRTTGGNTQLALDPGTAAALAHRGQPVTGHPARICR